MSSEIPLALSQITAELAETVDKIAASQIEAALQEIEKAPRVFVGGAGRSGLAIRAFAMRLMHLGRPVFVLGETTTPAVQPGDLVVFASGSGRTASLVAMAGKAKSRSARVLLLTIDATAPLALLADVSILIPAPSPKVAGETAASSVQPMGSLFEQALFLLGDALILLLMRRNSITAEAMFDRHANLE